MKPIEKIIDESLIEIQKYIQKGNYFACANISFDLLSISVLCDFNEGIFISNLLKNTFVQIDLILEQYEINEDERNFLKDIFEKNIQNLHKFYSVIGILDKEIINALIELSTYPVKIEYKYQKIKKY